MNENPLPKSVGHIAFYQGYEYVFIGGNNSVYRAPETNPMEATRYGQIRMGMRFESTYAGWKNHPIRKGIEGSA